MVHRILWPRAQDPFFDIDSLSKRLEMTARDLRKQVARLEHASAQNEQLTERLVNVIEEQKDKLHEATQTAEDALKKVSAEMKDGARGDTTDGPYATRKNGYVNGKH
jgi:DNA anti-recombination protein RmuC